MRAIPGDNLAYPIQITLENGSQGSVFYLHEENKDISLQLHMCY